MQHLSLAALLLLLACQGSQPRFQPGATEPLPPQRFELPDGAILCVQSIEAIGAVDRDRIDTAQGLLRECLRCAPTIDVAAGVEYVDSDHSLVTAWEDESGQLSTSLEQPGKPPIPLYALRPAPEQALHLVIDRLARGTMAALGHDPNHLLPGAQIYSSDEDCVRLTETALRNLSRNRAGNALADLQRARRIDPGCTLTLLASSTALLQLGRAVEAEQLALDSLRNLLGRMSPTTQHKMARLRLLTGAQTAPTNASGFDQQLEALAAASLEERPHDPHGLYSRALARNFSGRFDNARADLRRLAERWPSAPLVAYHLAFAELATGEAELALAAAKKASRELPTTTVVLPHALALYQAGEHAALERFLKDLAKRTERHQRQHEILRMQASFAILRGNAETAIAFLLRDLEWLRKRPTQLNHRSLELVELGEALVLLGAADQLGSRLAALQDNVIRGTATAQALAYLSGLVHTLNQDSLATSAIATLEGHQHQAWASNLRAMYHHRRGEIFDEIRELETVLKLSDDLLAHAGMSRALRVSGKHQEAQTRLDALRARMLRIQLRRPLEHPLVKPAAALAWLACMDNSAK